MWVLLKRYREDKHRIFMFLNKTRSRNVRLSKGFILYLYSVFTITPFKDAVPEKKRKIMNYGLSRTVDRHFIVGTNGLQDNKSSFN